MLPACVAPFFSSFIPGGPVRKSILPSNCYLTFHPQLLSLLPTTPRKTLATTFGFSLRLFFERQNPTAKSRYLKKLKLYNTELKNINFYNVFLLIF
jgi:hypothetical protein